MALVASSTPSSPYWKNTVDMHVTISPNYRTSPTSWREPLDSGYVPLPVCFRRVISWLGLPFAFFTQPNTFATLQSRCTPPNRKFKTEPNNLHVTLLGTFVTNCLATCHFSPTLNLPSLAKRLALHHWAHPTTISNDWQLYV